MRNSRAIAETYVQPVVAGLLALVTLIGLIGPAIKSPQLTTSRWASSRFPVRP
jgi:hypothetical protein